MPIIYQCHGKQAPEEQRVYRDLPQTGLLSIVAAPFHSLYHPRVLLERLRSSLYLTGDVIQQCIALMMLKKFKDDQFAGAILGIYFLNIKYKSYYDRR